MRTSARALSLIVSLMVLVMSAAPPSTFAQTAQAQADEWTRQFGSTGDNRSYGVATSVSGVYTAGNRTWLDGHVHMFYATVRRFDINGQLLWGDQFAAPGMWEPAVTFARSVAADSTGAYVVGDTAGNFPGYLNRGGDAYIRKYSPDGTALWTRQFGTSGKDVAEAAVADASGVYVAGFTAGALPGQTSGGDYDAFVAKYDALGTQLWACQFGTASYDFALGISVESGGVYVSGVTGGSFPGHTNAGGEDAFVRRLDPGTCGGSWTSQFGTSTDESAYGVTATRVGVSVAGYTRGDLSGSNVGSGDAFVRGYDAHGNLLWSHQFGTPGLEVARAITGDSTGVYVAGDTTGNLFGTNPDSSGGSGDVFIIKYDAGGNVLQARQLGTSGGDFGNAVAVDSTAAYLTGDTTGTFAGQTKSGSVDGYAARLDLVPFGVGINGGGDHSNDPSVDLSLSATFPGTDTASMRLSNSSVSWSAWEPYATSAPWTLSTGDGKKTVYAQFKGGDGSVSPVVSASIVLDTIAPAGSVTNNGGASYTRSVNTTLSVGTIGGFQARYQNAGGAWTGWEGYSATRKWGISGSQGTNTVYAQFRDRAGNLSGVTADGIIFDSGLPSVTEPIHALAGNTALGTGSVPVGLSWSASDATSGVAKYQLQQRKYSGGVWGTWGWVSQGTTMKTLTRQLAPGTYQFQVRAQDKAGNWSAWKLGTSFAVAGYQETSTVSAGKVTYGGTWATQSLSSHYGGAARYARAGGRTTSFTFTGGRQVAWVAPKGTNGGYAHVYLDGTKVATVNLYASSAQYRTVVFAKTGLSPSVTHILKVYVPGTKPSSSTGTRVDIDGFVVLR